MSLKSDSRVSIRGCRLWDGRRVSIASPRRPTPTSGQARGLDRWRGEGLQRIGATQIGVVTHLGNIDELDQGISHPVHSRDDYGFFFILSVTQNRRNLAVTIRIGDARTAELVNHPM